jgi:hypothetical protein
MKYSARKQRLPLIVLVTFAAFACAGRTRTARSCDPLPEEATRLAQPVYRVCEVDRKAETSFSPTTLQYTFSPGQTCGHVVVDVVVDSSGTLVRETAHVVRTTDPMLTEAILNTYQTGRYKPAQKDGKPVAQVVRIDFQYGAVRMLVPAGTPRSQVRPPRGSVPRC